MKKPRRRALNVDGNITWCSAEIIGARGCNHLAHGTEDEVSAAQIKFFEDTYGGLSGISHDASHRLGFNSVDSPSFEESSTNSTELSESHLTSDDKMKWAESNHDIILQQFEKYWKLDPNAVLPLEAGNSVILMSYDNGRIVFSPTDTRTRSLNDEEVKLFNLTRYRLMDETSINVFAPIFHQIRPGYFGDVSTAASTEDGTIYLGPWFFSVSEEERRALLLHEVLHIFNKHWQRQRDRIEGGGSQVAGMENVLQDLEINCQVSNFPNVKLPVIGCVPGREGEFKEYPFGKSYENYVKHYLENKEDEDKQNNDDSDGSGGSSQGGTTSSDGGASNGNPGSGGSSQNKNSGGNGQGNGESSSDSSGGHGHPGACKAPSAENQKAAEEMGLGGNQDETDMEKVVQEAANNLAEHIRNEQVNGRGGGALHNTLTTILKNATNIQINWRKQFTSDFSRAIGRSIAGADKTDRTRVSRRRRGELRADGSRMLYPGSKTFIPTAMMAIDTSGSMGEADRQKILANIGPIIKSGLRGRGKLGMFSVDTEANNTHVVSDPTKLTLTGGGGTDMSVAWKYLDTLDTSSGGKEWKRPDVFVLATDGELGTSGWKDVATKVEEANSKKMKSIILVTREQSFKEGADILGKIASVIDISKIFEK